MPAKSIDTSCEVEIVMGSAGADITRSALACKVEVPGEHDSPVLRRLLVFRVRF